MKYGKELFGSQIKDGFYQKIYNNHEIKAFYKGPNAPKGLPEFFTVDVLFLRVHSQKDWMNIVEDVNERALIHFKVVVWDEEIPSLVSDSKVKPNIFCKSSEKTGEQLFDEIIKSELSTQLQVLN